jgi:transposase
MPRQQKKAPRKKPNVPPEERGPGRPSKLTPEVREEIVEAIKIGNYPEIAAAAAGISKTTFYGWMKEGTDEKAELEFQQFREEVEKAKAFAERADIALIDTAANAGSWQAAAWKRERSGGDRWRQKWVAAKAPDAPPDATFKIIVEFAEDWRAPDAQIKVTDAKAAG